MIIIIIRLFITFSIIDQFLEEHYWAIYKFLCSKKELGRRTNKKKQYPFYSSYKIKRFISKITF